MPIKRKIDLFIFDVNETMFSLSEIKKRFINVNLSSSLVDIWFTSTLKEGFAFSHQGKFIDFFTIARNELEKIFLIKKKKKNLKDIHFILDGFKKLKIHEDVKQSLKILNNKNFKIVTLTNGSKEIAELMLKHNKCKKFVDRCFSVEEKKIWKPNREIYHFVCKEMYCKPSRSIMIASHGWDISGAENAGLNTGYLQKYESKLSDFYCKPTYSSKNCFDLIKKII